eukprot:15362840-Ditylum_brightwellii.AAC.1
MGRGEGLATTISIILPGGLISIHSKDFNRPIYCGHGEEHHTLSDIVTQDSASSNLKKLTKRCQTEPPYLYTQSK